MMANAVEGLACMTPKAQTYTRISPSCSRTKKEKYRKNKDKQIDGINIYLSNPKDANPNAFASIQHARGLLTHPYLNWSSVFPSPMLLLLELPLWIAPRIPSMYFAPLHFWCVSTSHPSSFSRLCTTLT